jgi:hypothetical protein
MLYTFSHKYRTRRANPYSAVPAAGVSLIVNGPELTDHIFGRTVDNSFLCFWENDEFDHHFLLQRKMVVLYGALQLH